MVSYYRILRLNRDATFNDIKRSYEKLILKYQSNRSATEAIQQAYNTLSNSTIRERYDRHIDSKIPEARGKRVFSQVYSSSSAYRNGRAKIVKEERSNINGKESRKKETIIRNRDGSGSIDILKQSINEAGLPYTRRIVKRI
jgi:curved DNA-binding protein CbpA